MKKITAIISGTLTSLAFAAPAFAQTTINTCPTGTFKLICNFKASDFGKVVGNVITTLLIIAVIIAIFFLIWGGIKWILSGGDKAKVESARNTIIGGIVGLVLAFLAYFIVTLVAGLFGLNIASLTLPNLLK